MEYYHQMKFMTARRLSDAVSFYNIWRLIFAIKDKEDWLIGGLFYFYVLRLLREEIATVWGQKYIED